MSFSDLGFNWLHQQVFSIFSGAKNQNSGFILPLLGISIAYIVQLTWLLAFTVEWP
ncbi:hypothetical protein [Crenothrix sp.]|uniref:hypothetical protein n=1 Tax=Crenothrix sp. TaxID=3100433 RepID=UPI00374D1C08